MKGLNRSYSQWGKHFQTDQTWTVYHQECDYANESITLQLDSSFNGNWLLTPWECDWFYHRAQVLMLTVESGSGNDNINVVLSLCSCWWIFSQRDGQYCCKLEHRPFVDDEIEANEIRVYYTLTVTTSSTLTTELYKETVKGVVYRRSRCQLINKLFFLKYWFCLSNFSLFKCISDKLINRPVWVTWSVKVFAAMVIF